MGWLTRIASFAAGLYMICLAYTQLVSGRVVFPNASYHQTTFAASGMGVGIVLLAMAFLPPNDWVYKHITTIKSPRTKAGLMIRRRRPKRS